ncbi:uncharacterized protein [Ptychodera flava]|uniref:uncharacterized protein n=1 Tax=Ptychodera flava TaxID=63121 RepID=UPI00396A566A
MAENSPPPGYSVEFRGDIAILWMNNGENRFNLDTLAELNRALDKIESSSSTRAMITTGVAKFYSNGFDLARLQKSPPEYWKEFIGEIYRIWIRLLTFPVPTVAALNGHCYAGGALFALCHDYRVMRTRRGWWCFPEIQLNTPFLPPMLSLLRARLPSSVLRDMLVFGKQYIATELLQHGVIDGATEQSGLLDMAIGIAKDCLGKQGYDCAMLSTMKRDVNVAVIDELKASEQYKSIKSKL